MEKPEWICWSTQYLTGASLLTQTVKNLPAMWETQVRALDWEGPLEKGMATHFTVLSWRIPWTGNLTGYSPWGHELNMTEQLTLSRTSTVFTSCIILDSCVSCACYVSEECQNKGNSSCPLRMPSVMMERDISISNPKKKVSKHWSEVLSGCCCCC